MKPTAVLSEEHRVIEVMLVVLEKMVEKSRSDGRLDGEDARSAIDFIRMFADKCHHGKEEDLLFVRMNEKGIPRHGGPVAVMLDEHEQGRTLVKLMSDNITSAAAGDESALREFGDAAGVYVALLRTHIQKEDTILFPLADRVFDNRDQQELEKSFETVEHDHMGAGTHKTYLHLAKSLAEKYGVESSQANFGFCSCGH